MDPGLSIFGKSATSPTLSAIQRFTTSNPWSCDPVSGARPGLGPDAEIWSSLETKDVGPDKTGWRGWKRSDGELWGAIWRYKNNETPYYNPAGATRLFLVEAEDTTDYGLVRYKFKNLDQGYTATVFETVSGPVISGTASGGDAYYYIPGVDQNPTFLKLEEK